MDAPSVDEPMDEQDPPTEVVREFDFAFSPAYAAAARPFGITAATTSVEVGPHWLYVRYGPWKLLTRVPMSLLRTSPATSASSRPPVPHICR
jgi:hypothetical protein